MKKIVISAVALTAIIGSLSSVSAADGINILDNIAVSGEFRPRFEMVTKEDDGKESAKAITMRTRLAISTNSLVGIDGLSAKIGLTSVNNFGYTDYAPEDTSGRYETILDKQQAMLSEGYVSYTALNTTLLVGRSHINLDDQRFIGTVGWRQMERSYDTVTVINKSVDGLTLLGAFVYGYAGVSDITTTETNSALFNVNYKMSDALVLSAFDYMLADIHDTYGLRVSGVIPISSVKLDYAASYAQQTDASIKYHNTTTTQIDASYYDIAVGAQFHGVIVGAEYEVLGKANGLSAKGFTTPLATLHKFQGFADEFLGQTATTNNNGLNDASFKLGYTDKSLGKLIGFYHIFNAETGTTKDLGSEFDAVYTNAIPGINNLNGLLKMAMFQAGETGSGHAKNNNKVWAQLDYKF